MASPAAGRAVVFDIGNVLLRWSPERLYARLLPDPAERKALFRRVGLEEMNLAGDRDGDLQGKVEALARRHPEEAGLIRAWWERWPEMLHTEIPESVATLRRLRAAGVTVAACTNFSADGFERARRLYPVLDEFDLRVVSGREHVVKPDPRIFGIVEERTGLTGPALFFTDDAPANIAAAAARGWRTHLFADESALAPALRDAGFPA